MGTCPDLPVRVSSACKCHDPVGFRRLTGVRRVRLLPSRRGTRDLRPHDPYAGRGSIDRAVAVEDAGAVLETALHRRIEIMVRLAPVEPPYRPTGGLRIVRAQGRGPIRAARRVDRVLLDIRSATHERAVVC